MISSLTRTSHQLCLLDHTALIIGFGHLGALGAILSVGNQSFNGGDIQRQCGDFSQCIIIRKCIGLCSQDYQLFLSIAQF